jgi:hypothetical protein
MAKDRHTKLIIVFVSLLLLLNKPILDIADKKEMWFGVPALYFYFFFVWLLAIVAVGLVVKNKQKIS